MYITAYKEIVFHNCGLNMQINKRIMLCLARNVVSKEINLRIICILKKLCEIQTKIHEV